MNPTPPPVPPPVLQGIALSTGVAERRATRPAARAAPQRVANVALPLRLGGTPPRGRTGRPGRGVGGRRRGRLHRRTDRHPRPDNEPGGDQPAGARHQGPEHRAGGGHPRRVGRPPVRPHDKGAGRPDRRRSGRTGSRSERRRPPTRSLNNTTWTVTWRLLGGGRHGNLGMPLSVAANRGDGRCDDYVGGDGHDFHLATLSVLAASFTIAIASTCITASPSTSWRRRGARSRY